MRNYKVSFLPYHLGFILIITLRGMTFAQAPISQVEGFLEVYHSEDSTSLYLGKSSGTLVSPGTKFNTFIGTGAVEGFVSSQNTIIGFHAGRTGTGGGGNTIVGNEAGYSLSDGFGVDNCFFGVRAGHKNMGAAHNSFFGAYAGFENTTGTNNAFFGNEAGVLNVSGNDNSYFGNQAGSRNTSGELNSFFGASAGRNNTASNNSFFGGNAGFANTSGARNSFFGAFAGEDNTTGRSNSFFGMNAGEDNDAGSWNSFFGQGSGMNNSTGESNSFFGFQSGLSNTTGNYNCFYGDSSGADNTTGYDNSFYGESSGKDNTTGTNNSFYGSASGSNNETGIQNSFFGTRSGWGTITGSFNSYFGDDAGSSNISGEGNSFFGEGSGGLNKSGSNNTLVGVASGRNILGNNNISIGALSGPIDTSVAISNRLFIDVSQTNDPLIYGEFDNNHVEINGTATIDAPDADGQVYLTLATERGWSFRQYGVGPSAALRLSSEVPANNNKNFLIDTDGNVGIDFNIPTAKLHVGGNIIATGTIMGSSDVNRKELFRDIEPVDILNKVAALEISEWQFKDSDERHIGPMAQDFWAAFRLGRDEKSIATVDADGVALAAIQALNAENIILKEQIQSLILRLDKLENK